MSTADDPDSLRVEMGLLRAKISKLRQNVVDSSSVTGSHDIAADPEGAEELDAAEQRLTDIRAQLGVDASLDD